ncbi:hypothetical protein EXU57_24620 [Segetibacter sp. 3557_3]|uniref:hypothetical protein n=1 Tax=Segetibacter sp. 3557_3 TaxID=2547429 RepID=UPI0010585D33|nr:hypothetical protein [Segetibacter sp. 3557_3]TDH17911.1 hypothetical protein EXU57_24620 [Segetibacter sp. 3557_3]
MRGIFLALFLAVGTLAIAQEKSCNLWLGDASESNNILKQFVEKNLEIQTKLVPAETNNIQEMRDENNLAQIKIWLKPKKVLVNGAMATVNTISSYKIVSLSEQIDKLYAELVKQVQPCTTETTAMNTVFGNNKIFIERNSGGFGKKGLPMSTVTITAR